MTTMAAATTRYQVRKHEVALNARDRRLSRPMLRMAAPSSAALIGDETGLYSRVLRS